MASDHLTVPSDIPVVNDVSADSSHRKSDSQNSNDSGYGSGNSARFDIRQNGQQSSPLTLVTTNTYEDVTTSTNDEEESEVKRGKRKALVSHEVNGEAIQSNNLEAPSHDRDDVSDDSKPTQKLWSRARRQNTATTQYKKAVDKHAVNKIWVPAPVDKDPEAGQYITTPSILLPKPSNGTKTVADAPLPPNSEANDESAVRVYQSKWVEAMNKYHHQHQHVHWHPRSQHEEFHVEGHDTAVPSVRDFMPRIQAMIQGLENKPTVIENIKSDIVQKTSMKHLRGLRTLNTLPHTVTSLHASLSQLHTSLCVQLYPPSPTTTKRSLYPKSRPTLPKKDSPIDTHRLLRWSLLLSSLGTSMGELEWFCIRYTSPDIKQLSLARDESSRELEQEAERLEYSLRYSTSQMDGWRTNLKSRPVAAIGEVRDIEMVNMSSRTKSEDGVEEGEKQKGTWSTGEGFWRCMKKAVIDIQYLWIDPREDVVGVMEGKGKGKEVVV